MISHHDRKRSSGAVSRETPNLGVQCTWPATGGGGREEAGTANPRGGPQGRPQKKAYIAPHVLLSGNDCFGDYFNPKSPNLRLLSAARPFRVYFWRIQGIHLRVRLCTQLGSGLPKRRLTR